MTTTSSTNGQGPGADDLAEFRARCAEFLAEPIQHFEDPWATAISFQRRLADAGLAGITIDPAYGGQGLTRDHEEALHEEAKACSLPTPVFTITLGMCVPVLLGHGTEDQKRRHVPTMLRGEEIWCQLFSEPNAGSDIAAAQLRAELDGDEWVLNGQKVWTSSANRAAFGMCIARTDLDVPKHRGLTMFVVPMDAAGITIRPLVQATGDAEFFEVFFDDVRLDADSVLGSPGQGWSVAISMLMNERATLGAASNSVTAGAAERVLAAARAGARRSAIERQALADLYIRDEIQRYIALRIRAAAEAGRDPGPIGSIAKLAGSDLARRAAQVDMMLGGAGATAWEPHDADAATSVRAFLSAPALSIAGGTSEIQRNIIGERVLGLPREPEVDKGVPFRDVRRNVLPGAR